MLVIFLYKIYQWLSVSLTLIRLFPAKIGLWVQLASSSLLVITDPLIGSMLICFYQIEGSFLLILTGNVVFLIWGKKSQQSFSSVIMVAVMGFIWLVRLICLVFWKNFIFLRIIEPFSAYGHSNFIWCLTCGNEVM